MKENERLGEELQSLLNEKRDKIHNNLFEVKVRDTITGNSCPFLQKYRKVVNCPPSISPLLNY